MDVRVIAIDWSGAVVGAHRKIWLAEVVDGRLVRLENGRDRAAITEHLIEMARQDAQIVTGLDFAFSLPAWYLEQEGLPTAHELWRRADEQADAWLKACARPFWGRGKVSRWPGIPSHFRQTERDVPKMGGISPKSVFQVGGAGAVGTGSLRGMRTLRRLHEAGFSIWPFDPPGWPRVVEIYPRLLTDRVVKSDPEARNTYLAAHFPNLDASLTALAASTDDAFDAAVSALVMARHLHELCALEQVNDSITLLEGAIWYPYTGQHAPERP